MPAPNTSTETRQRTTSAKRLHTLLSKLKSTNGVVAYRVVPTVMKSTATSEEIELGWPYVECMAVVVKMLADLELEINGSGLTEDEIVYHLETRTVVIGALAPVRMGMPWDQARSTFTDSVFVKLQGTDVTLRRTITEQMLSAADLLELRNAVEGALAVLKDTTLPDELKSFVSMHLIRIKTALDEYEFRGLAGLQEALAGYLGTLAVSHAQIDTHATAPQKRKFADVITVANGVMTLAHSAAIAWPHLHTGFTVIAGLLGGS